MLLLVGVTQDLRCWPLLCVVLSPQDACLEAHVLCWGNGRKRLVHTGLLASVYLALCLEIVRLVEG